MDMRRFYFYAVLTAAVAVMVAACGGGDNHTPALSPNIAVSDSVMPAGDHEILFGSVADGDLSDQTVTVTNAGTTDLVIGTVTSPSQPFSIPTDTCSDQTLAPGGTCTLTVRFEPSAVTSFTGSFGIPSDDPDTPTLTVSVSGTGTAAPAPNITVTDSVAPDNDHAIPFGSVADGDLSDQTVMVTNAGTTDLVIGTVTGPSQPFSIQTDTCSGQTLAPGWTIAPGGTCTLRVRFEPSAVASYTGSFGIPSNDPDTPTLTVSVSGTGTAAPAPNIAVTDSVAPDNDHAIPFGSVAAGDFSDKTVTVTNTGTADLAIYSVTSPSMPFSITTDTCSGQSLALGGGTCTLTVRFGPSAVTSYTGSFAISSDDPDTPSVTVTMSGTGTSGTTPPITPPATGQTACYDTAGGSVPCPSTGQDGDLLAGVAWPAPRFTVTYCDAAGPCAGQSADCDSNSSTDVVTDNLTGLVWAKNGNLPGGTQTWADALTFANDLTLCGYTDWKLPNRRELRSLVNFGLTNINAWLNGQGFSSVQCGKYLSSTTYTWGTNTDTAWVVSLCDGLTGSNPKATPPWYVLPVRSGIGAPAEVPRTGQSLCYDVSGTEVTCAATGQDGEFQRGIVWPSPRFSDNGDGTVTDNLTGLVWTQDANAPGPAGCTPSVSKTWQGALDYVACLNSNSYLGGGWRLPNINELETLFNAGFKEETCGAGVCPDNAAWLETQGFGNTQLYYWSSTTYAGDPTMVWNIWMHEGFVQPDAKSADYYYVWPVR